MRKIVYIDDEIKIFAVSFVKQDGGNGLEKEYQVLISEEDAVEIGGCFDSPASN